MSTSLVASSYPVVPVRGAALEIPLPWNLMWPVMGGPGGQPDGTFYFSNQPNLLDQFLVNKSRPTDQVDATRSAWAETTSSWRSGWCTRRCSRTRPTGVP
jgi:hypothetical protein